MKMMGKSKIIKSGFIPLGMRLSIYFILFGIIIGYLATAASFMENSKQMVVRYVKLLENAAQLNMGNEGIHADLPNELLTLVKNADISGPVQQYVTGLEVYAKTSGGWNIAGTAGDPGETAASVISKRLGNLLEHTADHGVMASHGAVPGFKDDFSFYIRLTPANAADPVVVRLIGNSEGAVQMAGRFKSEISAFTGALLLISVLLSQIFVKRIVKPIQHLSKEAKLVAEGKKYSRFHVKGRDAVANLARSLNIMNDSLTEQLQRVQRQADAMETMNRIDKAVLSSVSRTDLIQRVSGFTASLYPENGMILLLKNKSGGYDILYDNVGDHNHANNDDVHQQVIADMTENLSESGLFKIRECDLPREIQKFFPKSSEWVLNIPVFLQDVQYGSLLVTSDLPRGFSEEEIDIIAKLTDQIGVALQSLIQTEEKESLLFGSLKALSASIDAKSKWTAGHSERVERLALMLGRRVHLSADQLDKLSISALLHDIGKLSISETLLDKPGKLTDEEYSIIKTHPKIGADIFSHIPEYPEVLEGILYHHEAFDGSGYPENLAGEDIPIIARIICIADVFDALSEDRPYRKGMERSEITAFFREKRGVMFDPQLTDVFMELLDIKEI